MTIMFKWVKIRRLKRKLAGLLSAKLGILEVTKAEGVAMDNELILHYASLCLDIGEIQFDLEQLQRE